MTTNETLIKVEGLEKSFGKVEVLKGIDIEIKKGEVVCIIGPSGSGKSTFLRTLNLLEEPTNGKIFFEGTDITDPKTNVNLHRQKMGMVFQQFNLFPHMTVLKNMTIAPMKLLKLSKADAEKRALELLERVGLRDRALSYPSQLSGGQKQRVVIAGIIAMQPECIVLDEPTAMLDPRGRKEVMKTVKLLNSQGITVIFITHYMDEAVQADRVVVMNEGKIILDGKPSEVFVQIDTLKSIGLDVPEATELTHMLIKKGLTLKRDILNINDLFDSIVSLREV